MTQIVAKLHLALTSSSPLCTLQTESEAFLFMKCIKPKDNNLPVALVKVPLITGRRAVNKVIKGAGVAGLCPHSYERKQIHTHTKAFCLFPHLGLKGKQAIK